MSTRVESESAFVLHTRPYRNTSLLVDFFTEKYGRINAIARSARGPRSRYKNILRPFSYLWINWTGRMVLRNLNVVEEKEPLPPLMGKALYCGLYVNELLFKLLPREEPFPIVFSKYLSLIKALTFEKPPCEMALRYFEKHLLNQIGYGLSLNKEAHNEQPIKPHLFYEYHSKVGFIQATKNEQKRLFSGETLLAFDAETLQKKEALNDTKHLMRITIADALDYKKIHARELF